MFRELCRSDVPELLAIEESAYAFPWTEETFLVCFESGCIGFAITENGRIFGFVIIMFRLRECHVLNLCIDSIHQHHGAGRQLLQHALEEAKQKGAKIAYLEVRCSNVPAVSLYRHMGFQLIGKRKNYYPMLSGHEDALVLAKRL